MLLNTAKATAISYPTCVPVQGQSSVLRPFRIKDPFTRTYSYFVLPVNQVD